MIHFFLLISRQSKTRLAKYYSTYDMKEKQRIQREVASQVVGRPSRLCNFLEWQKYKLVYKRYASLFFVCGIDPDDNELIALELIHQYVEVLDRYFGNVCELDLIFNFHKAYYLIDEMVLAGEIQESSKKAVLRAVSAQDTLIEAGDAKPDA